MTRVFKQQSLMVSDMAPSMGGYHRMRSYDVASVQIGQGFALAGGGAVLPLIVIAIAACGPGGGLHGSGADGARIRRGWPIFSVAEHGSGTDRSVLERRSARTEHAKSEDADKRAQPVGVPLTQLYRELSWMSQSCAQSASGAATSSPRCPAGTGPRGDRGARTADCELPCSMSTRAVRADRSPAR